MWRALLIAGLLMSFAAVARAQDLPWQTCRGQIGVDGPSLTGCRPLVGKIDPQGRELWLRTAIPPRAGEGHKAAFVIGAASSEAWFNGVRLGANGQPGPTPAAERPGRYQAELPIPDALWRPVGNVLVVRMSAHHVGMRFASPIGWVGVGAARQPSMLPFLAVSFVAAGALAAAAFGFGAIYAMRRT